MHEGSSHEFLTFEKMTSLSLLVCCVTALTTSAFAPPPSSRIVLSRPRSLNEDDGTGYTAKQRLREEIDSPFRKVRVVLFGFSAASALVAFYFSILTFGKALAGFDDAPTPTVAATDVAVNALGAAAFSFLAYRDVKAGEANLERIAKGGQLAALRVAAADGSVNSVALAKFRGTKRVLIAAGGPKYVAELAADLPDVAADLERVDVVVIPALLDDADAVDPQATRTAWRREERNVASDAVVYFPAAAGSWTDYLRKEIATAKSQGFDAQTKGLGIYLKKNGRILRRATGQPDWATFVGTMEVMDGSQFGKPKF